MLTTSILISIHSTTLIIKGKTYKTLQEENYELPVQVSMLCMESKHYTKNKYHI